MDSSSFDPDEIRGPLRTARLVVVALVAGVAAFAVFAVMRGIQQEPADDATVSMVMALMGVMIIVSWFFVPSQVVNQARRGIAAGTWPPPHQAAQAPTTDAGKLGALFVTKTIVGASLLEGGAFGNLIAFMLEGQWYSLVLAAVLLLGIVLAFPVEFLVVGWVEDQLKQIELERGLQRTDKTGLPRR